MRKILGFVAILVTACSNRIESEQKWADSILQKYPSSIKHIVFTTLPEENEYTLDIELKPDNTPDFKGIIHDVECFLCGRPKQRAVLVIDTSRLNNSTVASVFTKAQSFRSSLKWIHYNYGAQDVDPGLGIRDIDPTLSLINKRNFPNLGYFAVALSGDKKTNAQNSHMLQMAIDADNSDKIDVDIVTLQTKNL